MCDHFSSIRYYDGSCSWDFSSLYDTVVLLSANGLLLINLIGTRWDAQTADIHWDTEQKLFKSRYTTLWNF